MEILYSFKVLLESSLENVELCNLGARSQEYKLNHKFLL